MKTSEAQLHSQVCQYIKAQWPNVLFNSDMAGVRLTIGQATQAKKLRSSNSFPDISIYEPNSLYHGLFIELKSESARVWKKDGSPATEHIQEQCDMLEKLRKRGYCAAICIGFDEAMKFIIDYMKIK